MGDKFLSYCNERDWVMEVWRDRVFLWDFVVDKFVCFVVNVDYYDFDYEFF